MRQTRERKEIKTTEIKLKREEREIIVFLSSSLML